MPVLVDSNFKRPARALSEAGRMRYSSWKTWTTRPGTRTVGPVPQPAPPATTRHAADVRMLRASSRGIGPGILPYDLRPHEGRPQDRGRRRDGRGLRRGPRRLQLATGQAPPLEPLLPRGSAVRRPLPGVPHAP